MPTIVLLSSFHMQLGKCNSDELYRIIESVQPEVIFEELSWDSFKWVYANDNIPESVEALTIKRYLLKKPTVHIPVDTHEKGSYDFFDGYDFIAQESSEYCILFNEQMVNISQYGYSYLNSKTCEEHIEKLKALEEGVLAKTSNEQLLNQYRSDKELDDMREVEMLRNIYSYSRDHHYNRALFICGAQHRKPLMEKISQFLTTENNPVDWLLYQDHLPEI